jgi:type II secretory pathway pseudopilin PulG
MNASTATFAVVDSRNRNCRAGVTLLEVLVASGILVVGLASVASILPAAGTRLAQATLEDRAGTAAANAYADIVNRGLVAADIFGSGTTKSATFGLTLPAMVSGSVSRNFIASAYHEAPEIVLARLDDSRTAFLEDDLVYRPAGLADTPVSSFFSGNSPREFKSGVCWGAMLTPDSFPAAPGGVATLSIAVFRKIGDIKELTLTAAAPGTAIFQCTSGNAATDEALRKQYLPGCAYVLALPTTAPAAPKWIKITSSWIASGTGPVNVVLDLFPLGSGAGNLISSGTMQVMAFENLQRVDQYPVALE